MAKGATIPTRVTADVAAAATSVAQAENRTTTEQINYWLRIGMQVERSASTENRQILAVATGDAQFATLNPQEREVAHAVIDARIAQRAAAVRLGATVRRSGQTTVSIDDDGHLVELTPDGTRRLL
ncbi:hypothetical protein [Micropruina sp.]|uniref:TA system antitoxin ParD family protein n=1 Tax=Micropruina sp. TaxID=2737536 RepID=UPI00260712A5|nr:hypothetical protein [Micropruina sp.]